MRRTLHNQRWEPGPRGGGKARSAAAAVEFAFCMPVIVTALLGLWETGRVAHVSNVLWNGAREAARDASLGQDNLQTVANNLQSYLQSSLPTAFGQGDSTSMINPVVTLPNNTQGYTCWDNTTNKELFTLTFTDITTPATTDPTTMTKLDHYQIGIQVPYSSIGWSPAAQITGVSRIYITVDWACLRDAPFSVSPMLPAQ